MPPRQKLHRKGHSKRVKRFVEENDFELDPMSTLDVEDLLTERRHIMVATLVACFTLFFWIIAVKECRYFYVNPNKAEYSTDAMLDRTILEYTRSQIAFTCVSIFVIIMAIAFSMYTFTQQRYMFKRLAGGVYFIAAGVMLVMIEIESNNTNYEQNHFHQRHPFQAQWSFGLSYFLAWICLITFAAIGGLFIVYSRKRKLDIAADRGFSLS
ncbi:uncharacterized protein LOC111250623 isoform X3 [Varroa destructor]|uniref:Uncharacterized protein n=1 Tax=Varroa destructor TaxID=109461 RepID=A0A7M7MAG1_VARDE|nr:uncharacterized protein LOC111250623 isoform X3 [Varroa destructor]